MQGEYGKRDSFRESKGGYEGREQQNMYHISNRQGSRDKGSKKEEKPMQFSFNPLSQTERQKMGFDNS